MTTRQRAVRTDKFLGVNQKKDRFELQVNRGGQELVEAINADITDNLKIRRRKGYELWKNTSDVRKIWANDKVFLSLEGTSLFSIDQNGDSTLVRSDMSASSVFDAVTVGEEVYYSDEKVNGKFNPAHTDWEVEEPDNSFTLSETSGGLYAGTYKVAITYVHSDGRESGTGESKQVTIAASKGILISSIQQPDDASIQYIRIYVTEADSTIHRLAKQIIPGIGSTTVGSRERSYELDTQFLCPPPLSDEIGFAASRIAVAVGKYLFLSRPFTYHLFDLANDFLVFDKEINMVASVKNGLYISANGTYYVDLSSGSPQQQRVSENSAITGTKFQINGSELGEGNLDEILAGWTANNGIIVGDQRGNIQNLTEGNIDIGSAVSGASLLRKDQGITQIITSLRGNFGANLAIGDTASAVVVKQGGATESFNLVDPDGNPIVDESGNPVIYSE